MFLNNHERKKQDAKYGKLDIMYKKKVRQFEQSEKKVKDLSQKLRNWMHKYHDLELSVTEYNLNSSNNNQEDKIKQLQTEILKLNEKNSLLEKQLEDSNPVPSNKKIDRSKSWAETPITELDLTSDDILAAHDSTSTDEAEDDVVLELSPAFQAVLEKYAKDCNS